MDGLASLMALMTPLIQHMYGLETKETMMRYTVKIQMTKVLCMGALGKCTTLPQHVYGLATQVPMLRTTIKFQLRNRSRTAHCSFATPAFPATLRPRDPT